jgi:hypothetical protein
MSVKKKLYSNLTSFKSQISSNSEWGPKEEQIRNESIGPVKKGFSYLHY